MTASSNTPMGANCDASYPTFLTYQAQTLSTAANTTPDKLAADFGCIADVGTLGCGFEEQLEAPLKALWPQIYTDGSGNVITPNPVAFLSTTAQGTLGHGDQPAAQGGNLGFLRPDSLLAIVIVTDEEDCSSKEQRFCSSPRGQLDPSSPYYNQDVNLRCFYNKAPQYDVKERYFKAFQNLRPDKKDLVVFAAIVGVPVDLVSSDARAAVKFKDPASRDAYYAQILADDRMVEKVDPSSNPGMGDGNGNLMPSCAGTDSTGASTKAFPPRRIVQLAQLFGSNGIVQSICQPDFGPAMDAIIDLIINQLGAVCLPRPLVRKADGLVRCNVVWELPKAGTADSKAPTDCSQLSYLKPVEAGRAATNSGGGNNCEVKQLAVVDSAVPSGTGWYYDSFSPELKQNCLPERATARGILCRRQATDRCGRQARMPERDTDTGEHAARRESHGAATGYRYALRHRRGWSHRDGGCGMRRHAQGRAARSFAVLSPRPQRVRASVHEQQHRVPGGLGLRYATRDDRFGRRQRRLLRESDLRRGLIGHAALRGAGR